MHPIGRVFYIFSQGEGDLQSSWVTALEYATAGRGHEEKEDPSTGHPVFIVHRTPVSFPFGLSSGLCLWCTRARLLAARCPAFTITMGDQIAFGGKISRTGCSCTMNTGQGTGVAT